MKVTPDNIFAGAKIKLKDETLYVVKVNAKSFYATSKTYQEYLDLFNARTKGTTFVQFCKQQNIKQRKYTEDYEIEESEYAKKATLLENSKKSYSLGKAEKTAIKKHIAKFQKKNKQLALSPLFTIGDKKIFFLEENQNCYLTNINGDYVLISPESDEWVKISTVYDFEQLYDHTPWEKLSVFNT